MTPCACLGPINGEKFCPCVMQAYNLPRNPAPAASSDSLAKLAEIFKTEAGTK